MLDDLRKIHERDASDALGYAEKQAAQYGYSCDFDWKPSQTIHDVVVVATGSSAIAAKAYRATAVLAVPLEIVEDYALQEYVHANTLLVCMSYSGDAEEVLGVLEHCLDEDYADFRPMIVVVTSGGRLLDLAKTHQLPYVQLPAGHTARYTVGLQYRALAEIFDATPLIDNFLLVLDAVVPKLAESVARWLPTIATKQNSAKQIAQECMGRSVVVYSGPLLAAAAHSWKTGFNQNAKQIAWQGRYPDFWQAELTGWTGQPREKLYAVIDLRSGHENMRVQKGIALSERLLSGLRPTPVIVDAEGETVLEQVLWALLLGDFVTIYAALLNGVDPLQDKTTEKFRNLMEEQHE